MIFRFIVRWYKELLVLILSLVCYLQYQGKNRAENNVEVLKKEIVKIEQESETRIKQISERNREVVIVETRPDGTTIKTVEKTKEKTKVSEVITVDTNVESDTTTTTKATSLERYSAGVYYNPWANSYTVDVGARLGNLPLEAVIMGQDNFHNAAIGVRFRW